MDDNFWHGQDQPGNPQNGGCIMFGVLGEENPNHSGVYKFSSTDGVIVNDALLLTTDADTQGGGEFTKPRSGSMCICIMPRNGSQAFVHGFLDPVKWDEDGESDEPEVTPQGDLASAGDWVRHTSGGAKVMLRRGGLTIVEGGPGTSVLLSPVNNQMTLRSSNFSHIVNGYMARRGRKEPSKTDPETRHEEEYWNKVGGSYDRVKLRHGDLEKSARRELTITEVVVAGGQATAVTRTREAYYNDGSWIGEGPKYQWGGSGANEPMVLGNQLVEAFNTLINIIKSLKVNTAWGPSTPPIPPTPIDLEALKRELSGKILSTFLFLSKDPAEL